MIVSFIFKSESGNLYIYDDEYRLSILIHPEFEKAYKKSNDADLYYIKKYAYLRSNGFFAKPRNVDFTTLEESMVKDNIINTKQVVFEATGLCNLNCTYCGLGDLYERYDERIGKRINTQNAINLLKYIFYLKPKKKSNKLTISFYGGEALLNMNFIKRIVEVVNLLNAEKEMDITYSMTTNATLIYKYIDFLAVNKFSLLISLDGNEDNHSYRVFNKTDKNSFQKVIKNIDMIQRNYPDYFSTNVNFNAVLHNRNSVKDIFEFIFMRYNKIPSISEINTRGVRLGGKELLNRMFQSKRKSETEFQREELDLVRITHGELSLYKELTDFLKYYSINYYISNVNALLYNVEKQLPTGTCTPFFKKIFLTNGNKLLPCEKVNYKYSIGKVYENVEINIPEITRQYNFYYEHIKKFCRKCYAYRFCRACMFQMENMENINTEMFVCDNFYDQKAFKHKLQRIFSFIEKYPNDFSQILENVIVE